MKRKHAQWLLMAGLGMVMAGYVSAGPKGESGYYAKKLAKPTATGRLEKVEASKGEVSLNGMVFHMQEAKIMTGGKMHAMGFVATQSGMKVVGIQSLKSGDMVTIHYVLNDNGMYVASKLLKCEEGEVMAPKKTDGAELPKVAGEDGEVSKESAPSPSEKSESK